MDYFHQKGFSLLADRDGIWLISSSTVGYYRQGRLNTLMDDQRLGDISRPFFYRGSPAVVAVTPDGAGPWIFEKGQWRSGGSLALPTRECLYGIAGQLQVLCRGESIHIFVQAGKTIHYRTGTTISEHGEAVWQPVLVAAFTENWQRLGDLAVRTVVVDATGASNGKADFEIS
ncbi:MAG: hypothetical protein KKB20_10260 [Proteobacteria bacterium]|nr:hypothetical protein [Pseudomonadota bacterium]